MEHASQVFLWISDMEKKEEKPENMIEKRCENCSFWYRRFCTHHGYATFPDGLCEYYKMSKILPSK